MTSIKLNPQKSGLTCLTCQLAFIDGEIQRKHYAGEWHLYNVKRKVASLPPVSLHDFTEKLHLISQNAQTSGNFSQEHFCNVCHKKFQSEKAYENHVNSKKHKEKFERNPEKEIINSLSDDGEPEKNEEKNGELYNENTDELEESNGIPVNNCLFCSSTFKDTEKSLEHMSAQHGFYIPDFSYLADLEGLLKYLGLKIGAGKTCIRCNSHRFRDIASLQKHMQDKNHCTFRLDEGEEAILEFMDFYDYSEMYDKDEDSEDGSDNITLYDDGCFLTLPSGARIGHRSLMRYFKQSLKPTNDDNSDLMNQHRNQLRSKMKQLGWTGQANGPLSLRYAKDMAFMKRTVQKYRLKQSMANNKNFISRGRKDQM